MINLNNEMDEADDAPQTHNKSALPTPSLFTNSLDEPQIMFPRSRQTISFKDLQENNMSGDFSETVIQSKVPSD